MAATIRVTTDTTALTSLGMAGPQSDYTGVPDAVRPGHGAGPSRGAISIRAHGHGRRFVRTARRAAQLSLEKTGLVTVEQMTEEAAIEIGGSEQPVGNRESEIHVDLHHQPRVVMGGVMTPQRVHERTIAHEPAFLHMAAEVPELVDEIHARRHAHEQPAD